MCVLSFLRCVLLTDVYYGARSNFHLNTKEKQSHKFFTYSNRIYFFSHVVWITIYEKKAKILWNEWIWLIKKIWTASVNDILLKTIMCVCIFACSCVVEYVKASANNQIQNNEKCPSHSSAQKSRVKLAGINWSRNQVVYIVISFSSHSPHSS